MNALAILARVAALALAAVAGWSARSPAPVVPAPQPPLVRSAAEPTSHPSAVPFSPPLVAVSTDGLVTLRIEQQPLDWVLEQIALQTGYGDLRERVRPAVASAGAPIQASTHESTCLEAPAVAAPDLRRLVAAIERGGEAERFEGLLTSVSSGLAVPDELLKSMFETDASERVRLLALERYLEPRGGDPAALRAALEAAQQVPSAVIQHEARRRLDELTESQRPEPSDPQQVPP